MTEGEETQEFSGDGSDSSRTTSGDLVEGRYRLEEVLSGGVTATIWRAHDPVLGRDVALKIWSDDSAEATRSQQEELGAARALDPSLNELLDAGTHSGRPYLVWELTARIGPPTPPNPAPAATPPAGSPAVGPSPYERFPRPRRNRAMVAAGVIAIIAALLVGVGLIAQPGTVDGDSDERPPVAVAAADVIAFDPAGDGRENDNRLDAVIDGDPATSWSSDRYNTRSFGNLKPGLGIVAVLPGPTALRSLDLVTETGGWSAQVHLADTPRDTFESWGPAIAEVSAAAASESFDLGGRTVGAVLIWFTDLGPESNRITVADLRLLGFA